METRTGLDQWLLIATLSAALWVALYSTPLWWTTGDGRYSWNLGMAALIAFLAAKAPSGRLRTPLRAGVLLAIALLFGVCVHEAVRAQLALRSAGGGG